jgi:F-box domain
MPSIPVDVLREILEHVDKKDLATLCRINKIFCSCSQDVLYREIQVDDERVIHTLAQSTDLARRVCSFHTPSGYRELATVLRNMSSLRRLNLWDSSDDASFLDGCTFELDSFETTFRYSESLHKFLNSQSSLTKFTIYRAEHPSAFEETFLPNLTRVRAESCWLRMLIPGRPVKEVMVFEPWGKEDIDFSTFTLSTAPIQKLEISYRVLYSTPGSQLASAFPSLEHLIIDAYLMDWAVRIPPLYLSI